MVVRIRFAKGPKLAVKRNPNRKLAMLAAAMLTPASLVASMLSLWRLAADLNFMNSFAIRSGLFSHWQVWLGAAIALQLCSRVLNRYGRGGDAVTS